MSYEVDRYSSMKLGAKASLLLTVLIIAVAAATSFFLLDYQKKASVKMIRGHLDAEASSLAGEIRFFVQEGLRDVEAIAGNLPLDALEHRDLRTLENYLGRQQGYYARFENGLFILDGEGMSVVDYPPFPAMRNRPFSHRDYWQRTVALGTGVVGAPYVSSRTGHPVLTVTSPIKFPSGRVEAVVCGSINLLSPLALGEQQQRRIGREGYVSIVDSSGRYLIHPDKSRILRQASDWSNTFLSKALEGYEGTGETVDGKNEPMLMAARQIPELGWTVLTQLPLRESTEHMHEAVMAVAGFVLGALALILPLGVAAMRRITRPLEDLEKTALIIAQDLRGVEGLTRPFASSALDALRRMRSADEIGRLARAFFRLSVRLKQTLASLRAVADDWQRTFSSVQEALLVLDADGRILRLNRVAEGMLRSTRKDIVGRHWREALAMGLPTPADWPSNETVREAGQLKITTVLPGSAGIHELSFFAIQGRGGGKGTLLMVTDCTGRIQAEERLRDLAFHDQLTRLPNRLLLTDRLEQALATAGRNGTSAGVLFLDLDDFKKVNDTHGHETGDRLLEKVAMRLSGCLRVNDTLARYAGDEFVAVLVDVDGPGEAGSIAARMLESLSEPFEIGSRRITVGASLGVAVSPTDGVTPSELISHADSAMYRAKGKGKNGLWFAEGRSHRPEDDLPPQ